MVNILVRLRLTDDWVDGFRLHCNTERVNKLNGSQLRRDGGTYTKENIGGVLLFVVLLVVLLNFSSDALERIGGAMIRSCGSCISRVRSPPITEKQSFWSYSKPLARLSSDEI